MEKLVNRLLIVMLLLSVICGGGAYLFRNSERAEMASDDLTFRICDYINVNVLRMDVTVIPYDGERIRVAYTNDLPLNIERGDNSLSICESDDFVISLFWSSGADCMLYLYLPRRIYRDIAISTGGGNVTIGGVDSELISISTKGGNIFSENTVALSRFETSSGEISVDFAQVVEETTVVSRSGNVRLIFPKGSSVALDYETVTGDFETKLISGKPSGSDIYGFNGGERLIHATVEKGTLFVSEKGT